MDKHQSAIIAFHSYGQTPEQYCLDGWASAMIALQWYGQYNGSQQRQFKYQLIPVEYGKSPDWIEKVTLEDDVLLLDFSYKPDVLMRINQKCGGKLIVLDHHPTAEQDLKTFYAQLMNTSKEANHDKAFWFQEGFSFYWYSDTMAGSGLTWEYCRMLSKMYDMSFPTKMPDWLQLIQRHDLWQLDDSVREFVSAINSYERTVEQWNKFFASGQSDQEGTEYCFVDGMREQGRAIERALDKQLKATANTAWHGSFDVEQFCDVNVDDSIKRSPYWNRAFLDVVWVNTVPVLTSRLGELLNQMHPHISFVALWHYDGEQYKISLRASQTSEVDVGMVAKCCGGGGHRKAAGFALNSHLPILN